MMILITGAGGRVGQALEGALQEKYPDRVVAATREELDLTDPARVTMEMERLDPPATVVINCCARTEPHPAHDRLGDLLEVNAAGVEVLARASHALRCRFIHLSSVEVFSGRGASAYREEDLPDAETGYGRSRALGEIAAARGNPDHLILRLSVLFGDGAENDPLRAIRRAVQEGESLPWDDRRVTPLWLEDFVSALGTVLRSDWKGVLHLGNSGAPLLSEVAAEAARVLECARVPELRGGGVGPASFREGSGLNAALDCRRFTDLSGRRMRDWRVALASSLQESGKR